MVLPSDTSPGSLRGVGSAADKIPATAAAAAALASAEGAAKKKKRKKTGVEGNI